MCIRDRNGSGIFRIGNLELTAERSTIDNFNYSWKRSDCLPVKAIC